MRLKCGQLPVVVGAAPASDLFRLSFADILNEPDGHGYQRPIDARHSREFRAYIEQPGAATIPLTFNLRGIEGEAWRLAPCRDGNVTVLKVRIPTAKTPAVLAQVDCQHRLGMMSDSPIPLTFQCFLGLDPREEMAIFSVINAKVKGLSPSLLDYHTTQLLPDLEMTRLDLYIAKHLNDDPDSVWHGKVKLGGVTTQGSKRRISLRGLQTATRAFLQRHPFDTAVELNAWGRYEAVRGFWSAVASVWPTAWARPRSHLLTKGVGVTALSLLAADVTAAALADRRHLDAGTYHEYLSPLAEVDWSTKGPFVAYGGRRGAAEVHRQLALRWRASPLSIIRSAV